MNSNRVELLDERGKRERLIAFLFIFLLFVLFINLFFLSPKPVLAAFTPSAVPPQLGIHSIWKGDGAFSALDLSDFISTVKPFDTQQVVGVYVPGIFALPVIQQPADEPWFVSSAPEVITQFGLPSNYGTIGFLAHNTLAGAAFHELELGQEVVIVYGDGGMRRFVIIEIQRYQALDPMSPYSSFKAEDGSGVELTSTDLFNLVYAKSRRVVFQTCIAADGNPNWGRHFVIAYPSMEHHTFFDILPF
jgi:hypothetical protein